MNSMPVNQTSNASSKRTVKAVGLMSGGLDSTLAARVVRDLEVEVHGVYFAMPWGCCDKTKALEACQNLGISFMTLQLDERYLKIVESPKFGYGTAMNPCVDCRIHMFSRARQYMESIQADFVFTGEILGQRPMSQLKNSMATIEKHTGLAGRLLRPLCAQFLDPTIAEQQGLIDRNKLLSISGRSRKPQMEMAEDYGIKDYLPPAGGCLLTDKNFANRMKDVFKHGYRDFRETIILKHGRHFRISERFKAILGRNEEENEALIRHAHVDDFVFQLEDGRGPTLILKGNQPDGEILSAAAGLVVKFSRHQNSESKNVFFWPIRNKTDVKSVSSGLLTDGQVEAMKI